MVHLHADSLGRLLRVDLGGLGEWAEKGLGTLHPLYPRGSTVVSSGRGTFFARESSFGVIEGGLSAPVMVTTHPTASTTSPPPWQSP